MGEHILPEVNLLYKPSVVKVLDLKSTTNCLTIGIIILNPLKDFDTVNVMKNFTTILKAECYLNVK